MLIKNIKTQPIVAISRIKLSICIPDMYRTIMAANYAETNNIYSHLKITWKLFTSIFIYLLPFTFLQYLITAAFSVA